MVFFLFAFGLAIGSFLNVVIFRYSPDYTVFRFKNIRGRSHCPYCKTTLGWQELIPVLSFLIQFGQCRHCGAKLSWQYPLVELTSGFIFLLPLYFSGIEGWFWVVVFLFFLLISVIDYWFYLIPDELNLVLASFGAARLGLEFFYKAFGDFQGSFLGHYALLFGLRQNVFINHFVGLVVGAVTIGLIIAVTRGKGMGVGDLKLAAALGLLFGWPDIVFLLVFGFLIGSLASVYLLIRGRKSLKDALPFGPFLILGAVFLIFYGERLLNGYFFLMGF